MTIKAVIFDMGQVFIYYDVMIAAKKMSKIIKVPTKEIFEVVNSARTNFTHDYELGKPPKVYWGELEKKFNVKIDIKQFEKFWTYIFWPNKPMIRLIKKLKKKYKIAVLSNTGAPHINYLEKKYNIFSIFDAKIYSYKVKQRKPGPKIYKETLKKLKVRPNEAVFIDDRIENVRGAEKLGIHGIHFKNNKQFLREIKKLGVEI